MFWTILMILIVFFFPQPAIWAAKKVRIFGTLGPVFLCYAGGLLFSFLFRAVDADTSAITTLYSVFVLLAMPLILFSADMLAVRKLAKPMLISFVMNTAAVVVIAAAAFFLFRGDFPSGRTAAQVSGMLVGTYTGGTPNMLAIGKGLGAGDSILLTQTADIIGGGLYFFLLISILPGLLGKMLRRYEPVSADSRLDGEKLTQELGIRDQKLTRHNVLSIAGLIGLAALSVLAALGTALILPVEEGASRFSNIDRYTAVIMLLVTTFGVGLSFVKRIREAPGSYAAGQYFILMFSVAMGLCFDLNSLGSAMAIFGMLLFVQFGTAVLHLLLAKMFGIDRDTMMITSTAGVFGPAFIIPVAGALKNDEIILPGILCGILGYAAGNYLGIALGGILLKLCGA
ncbi:MAG: DUF819 family protein [Clostridia bacterium]|nr:DUF819 family protein [Clostridia bacterium]